MKKIMSILLLTALSITISVTHPNSAASDTLPYRDIEGSYAKDAIVRLSQSHVMNGTSPTLFSPARPITRAEFMTTLIRILHLKPVSSSVAAYSDVPKSAWYYDSLQAATEIGITEGTGNGIFQPNQALTRQEAAAWIVRALKQSDSMSSSTPAPYADAVKISDWARPYINTVSNLDLMEGSGGYFYPVRAITRQETAVIFDRLLQNDRWSHALSGSPESAIQIGWQYGQSTAEFEQSALKSNLNVLMPRWYFLESNGTLSDSSVPELAVWAKNNNKQVWALVGNSFDQASTHKLVSSPQLSAAVIDSLISKVEKYSLRGLNIDFENVQASDRDLYSAFIAKLADKLHAVNAVLSIDLPPDLGNDWSDAYDYAKLGEHADYVVFMAYEEHWSGDSAPGSVASLPWVRTYLDKMLKQVPAKKTILALPLYNRDWSIDGSGAAISSEDITLPEQKKRLDAYGAKPNWNDTLGQYTASYRKSGVTHRLWLEDSRSLALKYQLGVSRKLAGYAYWYIGGETPDVWTSLQNTGRYAGYTFE